SYMLATLVSTLPPTGPSAFAAPAMNAAASTYPIVLRNIARHSFAIFSQPCEIETPGRAPSSPRSAGQDELRTVREGSSNAHATSGRRRGVVPRGVRRWSGMSCRALFLLGTLQVDVRVDHLDEGVGLHEAFAPLLVPGRRGLRGLYI